MKTLYYILLGLLLALGAEADMQLSLSDFPQSTLQIATPDARLHRFKIWVAEDDPHREQGLMYVKTLADDQGMLFIYPAPRHIAMWMKNTYVPLDMIFIRADGRVASVTANAKPFSLDTIESNENVVAVLEVKGGIAARLNIRKGAVAMHPFFEQKAKN